MSKHAHSPRKPAHWLLESAVIRHFDEYSIYDCWLARVIDERGKIHYLRKITFPKGKRVLLIDHDPF